MDDILNIEELGRRLARAEAALREKEKVETSLRASEERQAFLLRLSDALRGLSDPAEIQHEAMRLLGRQLGVSRAQYFLSDETGEFLESSGGYTDGVPAAVGRFRLIEFGRYAYDGFRAGQTQVVADASTDPRIGEVELASYEEVGFLAYIGVPFVQRGRLVGTVAVHQTRPRRWTEDERITVEETAERAGIAVEQARAEQALRASEGRQAFLLSLADALRPLDDPRRIAAEAVRLLSDHLGADRVFLTEVEPDGATLHVRDEHLRSGAPSVLGRYSFDQFGAFVGRELHAGHVLAVDDVAARADLGAAERANYAAVGIASYLLVPLIRDGRLTAYFTVNHRTPRAWSEADRSIAQQTADRMWTAMERARAEAALRESEERFAQFAASSSDGLWVRDAATLAMEYTSPAIAAIYGVAPGALLGDPRRWAALIVPEDRDVALEHLERARRGEAVVHEFRIQRPADGSFRWIRNTDFPLYDGEGVLRIGGIAEDVTEAKLSAEHQAVLLAELQHRVRNIMAIVRSIAARTGERAASVPAYAELMGGRLKTLARVQALLTRAAKVGVEVEAILRDELSALALHEGQYALDGPEVVLPPKAAEVLTLAVHELATNALKHGALSTPSGRVAVRWTTFAEGGVPWLGFDWNEEGAPGQGAHDAAAPDPAAPRRRGFGSELIEGRVPYELDGRGSLNLAPGGARCRLDFPLREGASILETTAPRRATVFGGELDMTGEADLSRHQVLVIEDDYYLATDAVRALQGAGATVLGPCPNARAARAEMERATPTAAVVDINLGDGPSFDLARELRERGIPFVFVTGYDEEAIPPEFAGVARLQKPVELRQIVSAISAATAPAA